METILIITTWTILFGLIGYQLGKGFPCTITLNQKFYDDLEARIRKSVEEEIKRD